MAKMAGLSGAGFRDAPPPERNPKVERMTRRQITIVFALIAAAVAALAAPPKRARAERVVYLADGLTDEELITLSVGVASAAPSAVVLVDSTHAAPYIKDFLARYQPGRVVAVGRFPQGLAPVASRLGVTPAELVSPEGGLGSLADSLFPTAETVVACPAEPRGRLLQAACLAGATRAPLVVLHGTADKPNKLARRLNLWKTRTLLLVGDAPTPLPNSLKVTRVPDDALLAACVERLAASGPVSSLAITNPADSEPGNVSALAPWLAVRHHAPLLLTNAKGDNVPAVVDAALKSPALGCADSILLVASPNAVPTDRRPNPEPGKDAEIQMEPLTPAGDEPFTFAVGRLFHEDRGVLLLAQARQALLGGTTDPPHALVVSNPGGSLPFLETFSRNTARELANAGYQTTALFDLAVSADEVRRLLPDQDLFLWEGHHMTMVRDYGMPAWTEPMRPSLALLQSCLALNEAEAGPLLERGAVAVVGSATRTYSGTGGAFTLAYLDALLYDGESLGGGLRQAKNFLVAYALLKQQLLGGEARHTGANMRSAWAFTLWGDPTLRLPRPRPRSDALSAAHAEIHGRTLTLTIPDRSYDRVSISKYQAEMFPNARLAGLITRQANDDGQLVPFAFAEVHLPDVPDGKTPRLRGRVPEKHWVFCWDGRRKAGYLLFAPRPKDRGEIRFQLDWK